MSVAGTLFFFLFFSTLLTADLFCFFCSMAGVVKAMDDAMRSMNLEKVGTSTWFSTRAFPLQVLMYSYNPLTHARIF